MNNDEIREDFIRNHLGFIPPKIPEMPIKNYWLSSIGGRGSGKRYFVDKLMENVICEVKKEEENNMEFNFKDGDIVELSHGVIGVVKGIGDLNGQYWVQLAGCSGMYKYYGSSLTLIKRGTVKYINKPEVKKVIFSGNCTIVLFTDNTKVIVRAEGEEFDKEKGLAMALVKRVYGTNKSHSNYYDIFKKWIPEEKTMEDISIEITDAIMNGSSKKKISKLVKESIDIIDSKKDNNPCTNCPDRKTGCLTNCKKMQDYADECYNNTKKIEDDRVKEIEKKFGEKVRAMREKNKPEEVKKGFISDFYFKKDYHAQMFPKEFLQFCIDNDLVFYLDDGKETKVDPFEVTYLKVTGYLKKTRLPVTMKQKYVCGTKFHGWRPSIAVDVNYVVFSKRHG